MLVKDDFDSLVKHPDLVLEFDKSKILIGGS